MKKSAFIITKPFQYINASNIEDNQTKDCLLTDTFYNAGKFKILVEENSGHWDRVNLFSGEYAALRFIIKNKSKYSRIYIDSDFGIILSFYFMLLDPIEIYTYEEGYASYAYIRKDNSWMTKFKILISDFLGLKNWLGGNPRTKGMFLYQPAKFVQEIGPQKEKKILSFQKPLYEHMESLREIALLFSDIDFNIFLNKNVVLYVSNYHMNPYIKDETAKLNADITVIKPHPEIKENIDIFNAFDLVIKNYIPAEILMERILTKCNKLTVLHEGTFALEYFKRHEKMEMITLPK